MFDVEKIKKDFPILNRKINGKRLVYLDNAATSQKPKQVLDAIKDYYENHNANVHRGVHTLSEEATQMYEDARAKVAKFISARYPEEIIFTRGTTESINLAAFGWGAKNLDADSAVAFLELEHHSNMLPWQIIAKKTGAKIIGLEVDDEGFLKEKLSGLKDKNVKIVGISHASNFLATVQNVKEIVKDAHAIGAKVIVDGAQAVPHMKVDVQSLGCDFYAFSGHKMLGPMGIGVLYVRKEVMEEMGVYETGGGMIKEVYLDHAVWDEAPAKFEPGTPNVEGAVGLASAIDYLNKLGMENIKAHEEELLVYALEKLGGEPGVKLYGPKDVKKRTGLVAFVVEGMHPHDLAAVLDTEGVAVRSGHHCTMPMHQKLKIPATTRASFHVYNTKEDIDVLIEGIRKAKKILMKSGDKNPH